MYCPNCMEQIPDNSTVCPYCGGKTDDIFDAFDPMADIAQAVPSAPQPQAAPQMPAAPQTPTAPVYSDTQQPSRPTPPWEKPAAPTQQSSRPRIPWDAEERSVPAGNVPYTDNFSDWSGRASAGWNDQAQSDNDWSAGQRFSYGMPGAVGAAEDAGWGTDAADSWGAAPQSRVSRKKKSPLPAILISVVVVLLLAAAAITWFFWKPWAKTEEAPAEAAEEIVETAVPEATTEPTQAPEAAEEDTAAASDEAASGETAETTAAEIKDGSKSDMLSATSSFEVGGTYVIVLQDGDSACALANIDGELTTEPVELTDGTLSSDAVTDALVWTAESVSGEGEMDILRYSLVNDGKYLNLDDSALVFMLDDDNSRTRWGFENDMLDYHGAGTVDFSLYLIANTDLGAATEGGLTVTVFEY